MKKRGQNGGLRGHYVALLKWCNNFGKDRIARSWPTIVHGRLHGASFNLRRRHDTSTGVCKKKDISARSAFFPGLPPLEHRAVWVYRPWGYRPLG